jgi:phosphoserine phosphatase RsbU/P
MSITSTIQTVLIVDDEITNIKVLSSLLRDEHKILFATDGEGALKIARSKQPDLVLLDIMMPEMDGYEVSKHLKSDPVTAHIPVIFVTAKDQEQDEADGFKAGAIDFITKPFSPLIVKARVRNHLQLIGQRNTLRVLSNKLKAYHSRLDRELQTAKETQAFLLPGTKLLDSIRKNYHLNVHVHFEPCSELGGDYWGIKCLDAQRIAILIADFSGHGVNAALNTFRLHALLNDSFALADDPATFLEKLNARLSPLLPAGQYATVFFGIINHQKDMLYYSTAATPSPLIFMPGATEPMPCNGEGFPLGMFDDSRYEPRGQPFPPGASLLLYSDAVTEGKMTNGKRLGEPGLIDLLQNRIAEISGKQLLDNLIRQLNEQFVHPLADDLTVIYITREYDKDAT